jgi:hypothetical protein
MLKEAPAVDFNALAFDHTMPTESSPSYALFECDKNNINYVVLLILGLIEEITT